MVRPRGTPNELWPEMRSCHSAVSLCEVSDKEDDAPKDPQLLVVFGNNRASSLNDAWIFTVNTKCWNVVSCHMHIIIRDRYLH